jgi:polysaccharide biosynthesis protein PslG
MRRAWKLVLFAAVLALVVPGARAAAVDRAFFGVHYGLMRVSHADLSRMDRGRVGTVRRVVYWPTVEPTKGNFTFTGTDKLVGDLASRGIQLLPIVYGSPRYVANQPRIPPVGSSHKRKLWRQFLGRLVQRYGPGGRYWTTPSLYPNQHPGHRRLPIRAWQIWNEPNLDKFFAPHPSVSRYATLLRDSKRAIKGVDRRSSVVLGGLSPSPQSRPANKYLSQLYRVHGIKRSFDGTALNPYASTISKVASKIRTFRRVMKRQGDKRTGLWITELGWGSDHPDRFGLNKGLNGQQRMLKKSFRLIVGHRRGWHVKRLIWFDFRDPPAGSRGCSFCPSAGLFRHSGKPKPSWRAFKQFTHAKR